MEEKRPVRRQPDDHHFWSLIMLAVTAGGSPLVTWVTTKAVFSSGRLEKAVKLNKYLRQFALDDEDLRPLWDWISALE